MAAQTGRPLRIYLDSSDFTDRPSAGLEGVRAALLDYQRRGIVELRFSGLHVREAAHTAAAAKHHAEQRAQQIKRLCGSRVFLSLDRLLPLEALAVLRGSGAVSEAYRDDGNWLTRDLEEFARRLGLALVRGLNNQIDAVNKKAFEDRPVIEYLARTEPRLRRREVEIARQNSTGYTEKWSQRFHLTRRFWETNFPFRVLTGNRTLEELQQECVSGIGDVENFIRCWVDEAPQLNRWAEELREASRAAGTQILEVRALKESYDELAGRLAEAFGAKPRSIRRELDSAVAPDVAAIRREQLAALLQGNEEWFTARDVAQEAGLNALAASLLGALPAFDALLRAETEYFTHNARNERRLTQSDLGDLLHFAYIPYVDLFRCDRHNIERIQGLAAACGTTVVSPAMSLPEAIERAAAERGLL